MEVDPSMINITNITVHPHDLDSPYLELFIVIDVLFLILCIIGNLIVIRVILKNKILCNPSFMFIISVAAAHLFVGFCVLPMFIVSHFPDDHMTSFVCKFMMYLTKVSTSASSLSLVPMTIDSLNRYNPRIKKRIQFKDAYTQIMIVWMVSLMYAIWVPIMHDKVEEVHSTGSSFVKVQMCEVAKNHHQLFKIYILVDFLLMYITPLVIMIILYFVIIYWIWRRKERSADKSAQRMRHMITCSGIILVCSFGFFGFGNYVMLYRIFWGSGYFPKAFILRDVFSLLSFSLSWINVILLFGFNPTFRRCVFSKSLDNVDGDAHGQEKTNKIGCTTSEIETTKIDETLSKLEGATTEQETAESNDHQKIPRKTDSTISGISIAGDVSQEQRQ